jgi:hypothetical protein
MQLSNQWWSAHLPMAGLVAPAAVVLVVLWSVFWKGLALWHSAGRGQSWWFRYGKPLVLENFVDE